MVTEITVTMEPQGQLGTGEEPQLNQDVRRSMPTRGPQRCGFADRLKARPQRLQHPHFNSSLNFYCADVDTAATYD